MYKYSALVIVLAVMLAACGKQEEKAAETAKAPVEESKTTGEPKMAEPSTAPATESAAVADGAAIYTPCAGCHGANGEKEALGVGAVIAGQSKDDLVMKIKGYKDGSYGGSMKTSMMPMVANLNDDQIAAVAEYISGL